MKPPSSVLRTFFLSLALTLVTLPVLAAPTVTTYFGSTRVELSGAFVGALTTLGVTPSSSFPARLNGANASFRIATGEIDLETARGEIVHDGGLNLTAGDLNVNLSSFVIDTTGDAPVLTGLVKVNDSVVGRLTLFNLELNSAPQVFHGFSFGSLRISDVDATLSAEAAAALNDVFGVTAFAEGIPIGTARVSSYFYEPDRIG